MGVNNIAHHDHAPLPRDGSPKGICRARCEASPVPLAQAQPLRGESARQPEYVMLPLEPPPTIEVHAYPP